MNDETHEHIKDLIFTLNNAVERLEKENEARKDSYDKLDDINIRLNYENTELKNLCRELVEELDNIKSFGDLHGFDYDLIEKANKYLEPEEKK